MIFLLYNTFEGIYFERRNTMPAFTYEIVETVAVLSENARGWRKELNLVSWGGRDPKYDIREWSPEHDRMGKGVTLSDEEMKALVAALKKM